MVSTARRRPPDGHCRSTWMLKKSIHGFFNRGLAEVNSSKPPSQGALLRPESSLSESSLTPFSCLPYNPAR